MDKMHRYKLFTGPIHVKNIATRILRDPLNVGTVITGTEHVIFECSDRDRAIALATGSGMRAQDLIDLGPFDTRLQTVEHSPELAFQKFSDLKLGQGFRFIVNGAGLPDVFSEVFYKSGDSSYSRVGHDQKFHITPSNSSELLQENAYQFEMRRIKDATRLETMENDHKLEWHEAKRKEHDDLNDLFPQQNTSWKGE